MGKHMVHPDNNEAKPKTEDSEGYDANGSPVTTSTPTRKRIRFSIPIEPTDLITVDMGTEEYIDGDGYYWTSYGTNNICKHSWVTYVGIFDTFEYCEKCEEKKKKDTK